MFDDVFVLDPIELGDYSIRFVLSSQLLVRWIEQESRQMADDVHREESRDQNQEVVVQWWGEGGNEDEKRGQGEDNDGEPANDLQRVQWKVQTVYASTTA